MLHKGKKLTLKQALRFKAIRKWALADSEPLPVEFIPEPGDYHIKLAARMAVTESVTVSDSISGHENVTFRIWRNEQGRERIQFMSGDLILCMASLVNVIK